MDDSEIRMRLTAQRSAVMGRILANRSELAGIVADSVDSNADDEHDPEGATIAYERAQVTALVAWAQSDLDDVDQALTRLAAGCYSECERCHGTIAPERLEAIPAARTCIGCAQARPSRYGQS